MPRTSALTPQAGKTRATILLVHGWMDSWRTWQRVLPLLDTRFRVIAVDQLGFGLSSKPDGASYSTTMFADNLNTFISGLELDNVFLVGHSLGAFNAWFYAAKVSAPSCNAPLCFAERTPFA